MSPEKATGSQETAPLPDCSQKISTAQSGSSCSALLTPHPSPEARSRGRPRLAHFLSHCLPDNGQSSTESDQGLTTPQTQIRMGVGGAVGRKPSAEPDDQRNLKTGPHEGSVGGQTEQGRDVQTVPPTPSWTLAQHSKEGTLVNKSQLLHMERL